jgi:glutathione S-transferase
MMGGQPDAARIDAGTKEYDQFAAVLNGHLEGKQWILGNSFSIADICLGTTVEFGTSCGLEPPKHVKAWLGRLQARDAWKRA